jgi:5,5'-dehydrodivanillate O-demethylase oxygenase subunit
MRSSKFSDFAHVGPDTLAGRYLRRFWQPVFLSRELMAGHPKRIRQFGEYFTLYRGASGAAFLVEDRCPHRQTALSLGSVEGDDIRCFYHGWLFDGTGQCRQQPAEKASFAAKVRCAAYPVREYLGLVFAYLGDGEPPEFPRFPELEEAEGSPVANRHFVPCNYFQRIENDLDETHIHFVHRVSTEGYGLDEIPEIAVRETAYGILREGTRSGRGANATRRAHWIMPNVNLIDLPPSPETQYWTIYVAWRVPIDDETMHTFSVVMKRTPAGGAAEAARKPIEPDPMQLTRDILAGKLRVQDLDPDYRGLFVVQDNVALAGQGSIVDRTKERLGQSDKGIILLRKLWSRELRAMAEGRALKPWRRPKENLPLIVNERGELVGG